MPQETNSYTLEIRAKPQHHRFLIGRGGANIKKVRENTGARVVFPTPSDEDKELITIIGKKEGVEAAKQELLKAIKDLVWRVIWLRYQISSLVNYYIFLIAFWEFGDSSRYYLDDNFPYTCHLPACFKIYEIEKKKIDVDQWRENYLINFYSQIGVKHGS